MASGRDEDGVFLRAEVLNELEREKRSLKWQLSRATQAADARAAELGASQAKVKDLLTIVEMNKRVADKALKRSYTQETQLQSVIREREELELMLRSVREKQIQHAINANHRRSKWRLKWRTFRTLADMAQQAQQQRSQLLLVIGKRRRRQLAAGFGTWKQCLARYYVASIAQGRSMSFRPASVLPMEFLSDECFRLRFKRRKERKHLCFFAWKARWRIAKQQHHSAYQLANARLRRRILGRWRRIARRKQLHRHVIGTMNGKRLRSYFKSWARKTNRLHQLRLLLWRIGSRKKKALLTRFFTRLRMHCIEKCTLDWAEVLRSAQEALDEEKIMYSLHQDRAIKELHDAYAVQQKHKEKLVAIHVEKITEMKHQEMKRKSFDVLKWRHERRKLHESVARHVDQTQRQCKLRKLCFATWKRNAQQQVRLRLATLSLTTKRRKRLLSCTFWSFVQALRYERMRRRRLRAVITRRIRIHLLRSWLQWKLILAHEDWRTHAHFQSQELIQRMQVKQCIWENDVLRVEKSRSKFQLHCALQMADKIRERMLRNLFIGWASFSRRRKMRLQSLRRACRQNCKRDLLSGFRRWTRVVKAKSAMQLQLCNQTKRHRQKWLQMLLLRWRRHTKQVSLTRWNYQRKMLVFALWRMKYKLAKQRAISFGRFLLRLRVRQWQRIAFSKWKMKLDLQQQAEKRKQKRSHELMTRIWIRWQYFIKYRMRVQREQLRFTLAKKNGACQLTLKKAIFRCWRVHCSYQLEKKGLCTHIMAIRHGRFWRLRTTFESWSRQTSLTLQRRKILARLCNKRIQRIVKPMWIRWRHQNIHKACAASTQVQSILRLGSIQQFMAKRQLIRRTFDLWIVQSKVKGIRRQYRHRIERKQKFAATKTAFHQWHQIYVPKRQFARQIFARLINRSRRYQLLTGFRRWEQVTKNILLTNQIHMNRELHAQSHKRMMLFVTAMTTKRDLTTCFKTWKLYATLCKRKRDSLIMVVQIMLRYTLRVSWIKWSSTAVIVMKLNKIVRMQDRSFKKLAWLRWTNAISAQILKGRAAKSLIGLCRRPLLRYEWNQWKRKDRKLYQASLLVSNENAKLSMQCVIDRMINSHSKKMSLSVKFRAWKNYATRNYLIRNMVARVLLYRVNSSSKRYFDAWHHLVDVETRRRQCIYRLLLRKSKTYLHKTLHHWKYEISKGVHAQKMDAMRFCIEQHRLASAKRIASAMYLSWMRPCVNYCFANWKLFVQQRHQSLEANFCAISLRRKYAIYVEVFTAWRELVQAKKARSLSLQLYRNARIRAVQIIIMKEWSYIARKQTYVKLRLERLVSIFRVQIFRQVMAALRFHQQDVVRRQSMMVIFSAQNALKQQKRMHFMRNVAFTLQKRYKHIRRACLVQWKSYVESKKQAKIIVDRARRRHERIIERITLSAWRHIVELQIKMKNRMAKWNASATRRRTRQIWSAWKGYVTEWQKTKWLVYERLVRSKAQLGLRNSWISWKAFVSARNSEMISSRQLLWNETTLRQQQQIQSLEVAHEDLLLETVSLKQKMVHLRKRHLSLLCRALDVVIEAKIGAKRKTEDFFSVWRLITLQRIAVENVVKSLQRKRCEYLFGKWSTTVKKIRATLERDQSEQQRMESVLFVMNSSNRQMIKRRTLIMWKAYILRRRSMKQHARMLFTSSQIVSKNMMRYCWASWKQSISLSRLQHSRVNFMLFQQRRWLLERMYRKWVEWHTARIEWRNNIGLFDRMYTKAQRRRQLSQAWCSWQSQIADANVTETQAQLVIAELELWNSSCQHALDKLVLHSFMSWKLFWSEQRHCRLEREAAYTHFQQRAAMRLCFHGWKKQILTYRRQLYPVICVRTSLRRKDRNEPEEVCGLKQYRKHFQLRWRIAKNKSMFRRRVKQMFALSILLRSIRRQHNRVTKRAFWIWFARVQAVSSSISSIQFCSLPWRRPQKDITARMLLMSLEELQELQQASIISQQRKSWQFVAFIYRQAYVFRLRHGFNQLRLHARSNKRTTKRHANAIVMNGAHFQRGKKEAATARAFLAKLALVFQRLSFAQWKRVYIACAIAEAEAAQLHLLTALRDVTSYRQALDPYAST